MEQIGEKLMINLLIMLEDSKREMVEKLNHVIIQTKSYGESVRNTSQEKNQTPNGRYIDFPAIIEETKIQNYLIKNRRISVPRTSLFMVLTNRLLKTRVILLNLMISIKQLCSSIKGNNYCKKCIENRSSGQRQELTY